MTGMFKQGTMIELLVAEGEKLTYTHTCVLRVCGEATVDVGTV